MKKILFNDTYGLTRAVLSGRKTQTRREIAIPKTFKGVEVRGWVVGTNRNGESITYLTDEDDREIEGSALKPQYKVGEEIAMAQSYKDVFASEYLTSEQEDEIVKLIESNHPGCTNKLFVHPDLMPHRIRITGIHLERLQDISDEDCLKEGVSKVENFSHDVYSPYTGWDKPKGRIGWVNYLPTPQQAFEILIDKVSGKGTWKRNPYVWVYDFELVK